MGRTLKLIQHYGIIDFGYKVYENITSCTRKYEKVYEKYLPTENELSLQRNKKWNNEPLVSIVVPTYETKPDFLRQMILSVMDQTYKNWELCIADGSKTQKVKSVILSMHGNEDRIKYKKLEKNGGIAQNTNAALDMSTGEYICFLDHDDILTPNALYEMVIAAQNNASADLFYSDEDKVSDDLKRYSNPHFKPDYNKELLCSYNYLCHFIMIKKELMQKAGKIDAKYDGAQDYEYMLRCTELAKRVCHIPKILYHWRISETSTAGNSGNKEYAFLNGAKAISDHLFRCGYSAVEVIPRVDPGSYHVEYLTDMEEEGVFFQDVLLKPKDVNWKKRLSSRFVDPEIGMVAGKIIYHGRIVECGMSYDQQGKLYHLFRGKSIRYRGYQKRAVLAQDVSIASLEFAVVRKSALRQIGKINKKLSKEEQAIDLCIRLRKAGYRIVLDPEVIAVKSGKEKEYMNRNQNLKNDWGEYICKGDPYWNFKEERGELYEL
ncbi:glycosyltransferase family 2 protein [Roseburia inulinivorans]|jgi:glycosyltransferase involved in cell wall biosynthesis|uniref:Glycosyltransferase n=1 Tax=Roseburia inulinivorans TaxID=360807 RepID=A0A412B630_9FIRM|nr:glycosyltransferase [Roseburia inulinivorans]RGQ48154.1 glycosyltransferase [Roseburia inulinivorans]